MLFFYLNIFENTDDFDGVRLAVVTVGCCDVLVGDVDIVCVDISGCLIVLATCAALCANVAGIGGGRGIFDDEIFSFSIDDEFDETDDDGDGILTCVCSSSIVFDATVRSRSFRTSRTVR